jgi:hypothetical protein
LMRWSVRLQYHREAFELLGDTPVRSASALAVIKDWERRHDRKMPKSVMEWYSLEGADSRLSVESIEYMQWPLAECLSGIGEEEAIDLAEHWSRPDLLPHMFVLGVRGEVNFMVRLHGPDDPLIFDDVDPDRRNIPFSQFVLDTVEEIVAERDR